MSRVVDFERQSSVPEARIQIQRRRDVQVDASAMNEASVRRPSLAQEVKEGNLALSTSATNPDNISNMEKGTTFAARARAAELNSVRAAAAAATKDTLRGDEEDEVPAIVPVILGSLRFTIPKRRDSAISSRPQGQAATPATPSTDPESTILRPDSINSHENITSDGRQSQELVRTLQSATLSRRGPALDQQAIRQKVREVSARQQSVHNASEEERHPHTLPSSASVSPYSSAESRVSQTQVAKKAELNTQHIREIRREAEKQRDLAQARVQNQSRSSHNNVVDENQRLALNQAAPFSGHSIDEKPDSSQYLRPNLNDWDNGMSLRIAKRPDGLPVSYGSNRSDYNASDQASLRLGGSPVPVERQQTRLNMTYHQMSSPMMMESTVNSQHNFTPVETAQSTSNDSPTPSEYSVPAQLRATSPAFVPSSKVGLGITYGQPNPPFPSVKGTERRQRSKHHNQLSYLPSGTWDHSKGRFEPTDVSSSTRSADISAPNKLNEDMANMRKKNQGSTSSTPKTANVRDPMPYTGFSKKEQLYEQLQKTIDETTAKGDLPASNRSVLFDPVASATTAGSRYSSSSSAGTLSNMPSSNVDGRRQKVEVPPFVFPQRPTVHAEPDYDPESLKDSDPLPPFVGPKKIETKFLSTPDEGHGYRSQGSHYSAAALSHPPGLNPNVNPFQESDTSNRDGFWNDSLAANSRSALVEESFERLSPRTIPVDFEQPSWIRARTKAADSKKNTWIEEQKLLLRPKGPSNMDELDQEAREWFDSGKSNLDDHVKSTLQRSEGISPFVTGAKYWEIHQPEHVRTLSGSRHAPIGSERPHSSAVNQEVRKRAAIDVMSNVLANLASYHGGENPGPSQRYSQPPTWCIDHTETGRKSFFNDNWGDVPKRVGRDPRYQKTVHEGRTTYFEDPNSAGRRDLPTYKATPGWGSSR